MEGTDKIVNQTVRHDRIYVTVEDYNGNTRTMPHANHIWLKHNKSFGSIPSGYVIHHLDHNSFNDDISNLVIMHKLHHRAYHLKNVETFIVEVDINKSVKFGPDDEEPYHEPTVTYFASRGIWVIRFSRKVDGKLKGKTIYSLDNKGTHFKTEKEARMAIEILWPHKPWYDRRYDKIRSIGQSK